jgi:hypothetical protein
MEAIRTAVYEVLAADNPMTVRQVFYQIVGRGVIDKTNPWPATVRDVKFGAADPATEKQPGTEFRLKQQVAELFEYIRSIDHGEIRRLEVKAGVPFSMQIESRRSESQGGGRD